MIESFDGHTPTLDPSAWVHASAVVIGRVQLGPRVSIWPQVTLRGDEGDITVGEDSNIQDGSTVHMTGGLSHTAVGARITVGHAVILHGCTVEDDCLIGMGAILLDGCVIGRGSYIGAGTLIPGGKIIPPDSFVFGNPFKVVRSVSERERGWIEHGWRHYAELAAKYRS